ncbi:HD-GYP domain-containing protein [Chitinimonas sp.]|uniref:HD-GYP domain-containing protein n=1 Tax=Chitinimonas sp. TaxID=1934313 RepID=UPI0035AE29DE
MIQRRIRLGEIAVGHPLPWNVYTDKGVLLMAEGARIQSADQLDRLLEIGLYIESTLTWHQPPQSALQHVLHACYRLAVLFKQPEQVPDFPAEVLAIAGLIEEALSQDSGVVMATVVLRRGGRYAVRHGVNAACVVACVLQAMGPTGPGKLSVLAAALTMNIGVLELQDALARQIEPLTPSQRARIERHPLESEERLRNLGVRDELWLRAVREHHEAVDGSGYPVRLKGSRVSQAAQLLGLADLFCARVSERGYRRADSAKIVLRDILIERGRHFDTSLAAYFIKALGVYPIGTAVQLSDGSKGVVSGRTERVDAPWVHALVAADGDPLMPPIRYDTNDPRHAIVDTLCTADLGVQIDMESIWGEGASDFRLGHFDPQLRAVDFSV